MDPNLLGLELTKEALTQKLEGSAEVMHKLKALGCRVS